jgi:hypothetical protein
VINVASVNAVRPYHKSIPIYNDFVVLSPREIGISAKIAAKQKTLYFPYPARRNRIGSRRNQLGLAKLKILRIGFGDHTAKHQKEGNY